MFSKCNEHLLNAPTAEKVNIMVDKNGRNDNKLAPSDEAVSAKSEPPTSNHSVAHDAAKIMRETLSGALATTHHDFETPYASLVNVALEPDGSPILLLSRLAIHTQNLLKNPDGCLLFQQASDEGDPLEGGRVSVWGKIEETSSPRARQRFLSRHPSAEFYADFSDFAFFTMAVQAAHFVGGFGRIRPLSSEDLLTDCSDCSELLDLETGFLSHMNKDHSESVSNYATKLLGAPPGDWRLTGIDPEGADLVCGSMARRLDFETVVKTPTEMHVMLEGLANKALTMRSHPPECGHDHSNDNNH